MSEYIAKTRDYTSADGRKYSLPLGQREEIVRCRDCEHYDPHCTDDGVCFLPDGDGDFARWEVKPDGFCAWGVRKVDA